MSAELRFVGTYADDDLTEADRERVTAWLNNRPDLWTRFEDRIRVKTGDGSEDDGAWHKCGAEFVVKPDGSARLIGDTDHQWASCMSAASIRRALQPALKGADPRQLGLL